MKRTLTASALMVLLALSIMLVGFNLPQTSGSATFEPILLLAEDDTGAFFLQLRLGAQKALAELNCDLTTEIVRAQDLQSAAASWSGKHYSGALVYIENPSLRAMVLDRLDVTGIPVVVIDHWDERHTAVHWDEAELGRRLALLSQHAEKVCILGGSVAAKSGAKNALGQREVCMEMLDTSSPDQAILALDTQTAANLCAEKIDHGWKCAIYAVDPGESRAVCLESGAAQALLIPSPYAAGYHAAAVALWERSPQLFNMTYYTVLPEEMYDAKNVKLVFPLLN